MRSLRDCSRSDEKSSHAFHFRRPPNREIFRRRSSERLVRACGACTRLRKGKFYVLFRRIRLTGQALTVEQVYGLRDGIYLKRPAAMIWPLWTFVTPTRQQESERPGAKDNTSTVSCRFPEVAAFGTPWNCRNFARVSGFTRETFVPIPREAFQTRNLLGNQNEWI